MGEARLYMEHFGIGRLQLWLDMHVSQRPPILPVTIDASRQDPTVHIPCNSKIVHAGLDNL